MAPTSLPENADAHLHDSIAADIILESLESLAAGNIPISLTELHALSNDILSLAGDDSVDSAWYTRRAAVGAIYAAAEVVMTRDPTISRDTLELSMMDARAADFPIPPLR